MALRISALISPVQLRTIRVFLVSLSTRPEVESLLALYSPQSALCYDHSEDYLGGSIDRKPEKC